MIGALRLSRRGEHLGENAEVAGEVVGAHRFDLRRGRAEERPHLLHEIVLCRKVDVRLPGRGISHSLGARPVHLIITMIVDSDQ